MDLFTAACPLYLYGVPLLDPDPIVVSLWCLSPPALVVSLWILSFLSLLWLCLILSAVSPPVGLVGVLCLSPRVSSLFWYSLSSSSLPSGCMYCLSVPSWRIGALCFSLSVLGVSLSCWVFVVMLLFLFVFRARLGVLVLDSPFGVFVVFLFVLFVSLWASLFRLGSYWFSTSLPWLVLFLFYCFSLFLLSFCLRSSFVSFHFSLSCFI